MSDILLVEGNNELNVQLTLIQAAQALFVYASDIVLTTPDYTISVDIKNEGGAPGQCTVDAYATTEEGPFREYTAVATATINPGETKTLTGRIVCSEAGWQLLYIISEAGPLSYKFGRSLYPISVDFPTEITSGSQFWASMAIHIPQGAPQISAALGVSNWGVNPSICGGWLPVGTYGDVLLKGVSSAGKWIMAVATRTLMVAPGVYKHEPVPPGTYDVISQVSYWSGGTLGLTIPIWAYKVGQIKVVLSPLGISGLQNLVVSPTTVSRGGTVTATVDVVNSGYDPVTWEVEHGVKWTGWLVEMVSLQPSEKTTLTYSFTVPSDFSDANFAVLFRIASLFQSARKYVNVV